MLLRIKELREQIGYTQKQLAESVGVLQNTVSQWETESVTPKTKQLPDLARIFGCEIGDLFARDPPGIENAS